MKLSIIIPLYNCEKYISGCLDSIYESNVDESQYEVIIINDGSVDNGVSICENYQSTHTNLILLSQENKGASTARNKGLEISKGDYIWFVDADDKVDSTFLAKVFTILEANPNVEMLSFNHSRIYNDKRVDNVDYPSEIKISGLDYLRNHSALYLWNNIYKRSSIGGHSFLDGTKNIEDMLFDLDVVIDVDEVMCFPDVGYYYNNTNSVSTSKNLSRRNLVKLAQDSVDVLCSIKARISSQQNMQKCQLLQDKVNMSVVGFLFSLSRFYTPRFAMRYVDRLSAMSLYPAHNTENNKANLFLTIANNRLILKFLCIVNKLFK